MNDRSANLILDELPASDFADFLAEHPTPRRGLSLDPGVNARAALAERASQGRTFGVLPGAQHLVPPTQYPGEED
jgi:hypothetical protein